MAALPREAPSVNVASWTVRAELQAVSGTSTLVAKVCHATVFVKSWHHWILWGAQLLFLSGEWFWMLRCPGPTTKRSGHCCCVIFYLKKSKYCYSNCFSFVSSVQATEFVVHKKLPIYLHFTVLEVPHLVRLAEARKEDFYSVNGS